MKMMTKSQINKLTATQLESRLDALDREQSTLEREYAKQQTVVEREIDSCQEALDRLANKDADSKRKMELAALRAAVKALCKTNMHSEANVLSKLAKELS